MRWLWWLGIGLLSVALPFWVSVERGRAYPTAAVADRVIEASASADWFQQLAGRLEEREILARSDWESHPVRLQELGFSVDVAQTAALVKQLDEPLSPWAAARAALIGPPEPKAIGVQWSWDERRARTWLMTLAPEVRREPVDAMLDVERRLRSPEQPGRELDVESTLERVRELVPNQDSMVQLVFRPIAPRVALSELPPIDVTQVLAVYETDFSHKRGPRVHNIAVAAEYLDGAILEPGETLSFNQRVGKRVAERGFIDAPVIVNDEMESGMGGGVCQVATTLHAAAVFGALDITQRRSHSRPSGYAPLGLDATVIDGIQDLRVRNPYDVPIYVRAYLPSRYVVRVELLGLELPGKVTHEYSVTRRYPFTRRVVEKPDLEPGVIKETQSGGYGYDTVSKVVIPKADGRRAVRRYKSKYYPVPQVLWVGPGTLEHELPPLPEGAVAALEEDADDFGSM